MSVMVRLKVAERVAKRSSVGSVTMVIARARKSQCVARGKEEIGHEPFEASKLSFSVRPALMLRSIESIRSVFLG